MIITKCNVCGQEIPPDVIPNQVTVTGTHGMEVYHLCNECYYPVHASITPILTGRVKWDT